MSRSISLLMALALVVGACSSTESAETSTTTSTSAPSSTSTTSTSATTSTAPTTTTTTTIVPVGYSPLNGLPVYDEALLDRRLLMVKLDNSLPAQPQSGIQLAGAVFELVVYPDTTRFIAMFHDTDADYVGPIRSVRPTDIYIGAGLNGTLVNTGGQPWISAIANAYDVSRVTFHDSIMYRIAGRVLPHNVYGSTLDFREYADGRGFADDPPTALFEFGDTAVFAYPASNVTLDWRTGRLVEWRFNADTGTYERWFRGEYQEWVAEDGERGRLDADVLIVLSGRQYTAYAPAGASPDTPVPAWDTTSSGTAWMFTDGHAWVGTWDRNSEFDPIVLYDEFGNEITVPPGRLWVSLFPNELVDFE